MFIADIWIDNVVDVVRVNERIMYVKLVIGKQIVNIVTSLSLCSLESLSKKAFSLVATCCCGLPRPGQSSQSRCPLSR